MTPSVSYVVDASVAVKLFLAEPLSGQAIDLFALLAGDPAVVFHVPDLFYAECANIFWKQCQRGNCTPAKAQIDQANVCLLRLQATPTSGLAADALAIALAHGITAYDACYVALAQRLGVTFITADEKLVQKLSGAPYAVIWLGNWTPPPPPAP
jgi:predicted nucleic acid-binding protein